MYVYICVYVYRERHTYRDICIYTVMSSEPRSFCSAPTSFQAFPYVINTPLQSSLTPGGRRWGGVSPLLVRELSTKGFTSYPSLGCFLSTPSQLLR